MDSLKTILIVGCAGMAISVFCAGYLSYTNNESRNLALAFSGLIAVVTGFAVQSYFELRRTTEEWTVATELTIDRQQRRLWRFEPAPGKGYGMRRAFADDHAGTWLAANAPHAFEGDLVRLCRDAVGYEVATLLSDPSSDWKLRPSVYRSGSVALTTWSEEDDKDQSTTFEVKQWESLFRRAGSLLPLIPPNSIRDAHKLPPNTTVSVGGDGRIYVSNKFMWLTVTIKVAPFVVGANPNVGPNVALPNGGFRLETRRVNVIFTVTYSALRSQSKELTKYRDWSVKLADASRNWFAPAPGGEQHTAQ